jgi:hypothetical protein
MAAVAVKTTMICINVRVENTFSNRVMTRVSPCRHHASIESSCRKERSTVHGKKILETPKLARDQLRMLPLNGPASTKHFLMIFWVGPDQKISRRTGPM